MKLKPRKQHKRRQLVVMEMFLKGGVNISPNRKIHRAKDKKNGWAKEWDQSG